MEFRKIMAIENLNRKNHSQIPPEGGSPKFLYTLCPNKYSLIPKLHINRVKARRLEQRFLLLPTSEKDKSAV